jgi:hypothetical protein
VGDEIAAIGRGQLSYLTKLNGQLIRGYYPFVASLAAGWEVKSMEFLATRFTRCARPARSR